MPLEVGYVKWAKERIYTAAWCEDLKREGLIKREALCLSYKLFLISPVECFVLFAGWVTCLYILLFLPPPFSSSLPLTLSFLCPCSYLVVSLLSLCSLLSFLHFSQPLFLPIVLKAETFKGSLSWPTLPDLTPSPTFSLSPPLFQLLGMLWKNRLKECSPWREYQNFPTLQHQLAQSQRTWAWPEHFPVSATSCFTKGHHYLSNRWLVGGCEWGHKRRGEAHIPEKG